MAVEHPCCPKCQSEAVNVIGRLRPAECLEDDCGHVGPAREFRQVDELERKAA